MKITQANSKRGFTLVEIIVSLGIFAVVATVALGALIKIVDANRKAQTLQSAITNLNFALEAMSREMRVGTKYYCETGINVTLPGNVLNTAQSCEIREDQGGVLNGAHIAFNSARFDTVDTTCSLMVVYRFNPSLDGESLILERAEQDSCGQALTNDRFSPLVDPSVYITGYYLRVIADIYPLGIIGLSGYAGVKEKEKTYFDLQTAMSSRAQ